MKQRIEYFPFLESVTVGSFFVGQCNVGVEKRPIQRSLNLPRTAAQRETPGHARACTTIRYSQAREQRVTRVKHRFITGGLRTPLRNPRGRSTIRAEHVQTAHSANTGTPSSHGTAEKSTSGLFIDRLSPDIKPFPHLSPVFDGTLLLSFSFASSIDEISLLSFRIHRSSSILMFLLWKVVKFIYHLFTT